jgi:hypothetical protein
LRSDGRVPWIGAGGVGRLSLLVDIPATSDPQWFDGMLAINPLGRSHRRLAPSLLVPVRAEGLDLSSVTVVPSSLTFHTTTWVPWGDRASGRVADLELRGIGASRLRREPASLNGTAVLHSSDGGSVIVRIGLRHEGHGLSRFVVEVVGRPEAGSYSGVLSISESASSPSISITVLARDGIVWTLIAVGVGTVLGGLLPLLGRLARRRDLLRSRLHGALIDYFDARDLETSMEWHDLDESVGSDREPWKSRDWMATPSLHGAVGLFSLILWAANDEVLDEAEEEVDYLIGQMERWIKLAPKVDRLNRLISQPMLRIGRSLWTETDVDRGSRALLYHSARVEPFTDEATKAAVEALRFQTRWHEEVAAVWWRLALAEELSAKRRTALLRRLLRIAASQGPREERTPEQWAMLAASVATLRSEHPILQPQAEAEEPAVLALVPVSPPMPSLASEGVPKGSEVKPKGVRWVTRQLTAPLRLFERLFPSSRKPLSMVAASQRRDLLLSAIAALGAILVYVLPIYTDTWGTVTDYLTAVAAGFGSQAIVRWGALPIFESRRLLSVKALIGGTEQTVPPLRSPEV